MPIQTFPILRRLLFKIFSFRCSFRSWYWVKAYAPKISS